jgi:hypothetical protein
MEIKRAERGLVMRFLLKWFLMMLFVITCFPVFLLIGSVFIVGVLWENIMDKCEKEES